METKPKSTRSRKTTARTDEPARAAKRTIGTRSAARASAGPGAPTHEQIALRAHELYVRSGHQHGREQEFWFEAERQLRDEAKSLRV